MLFKRYGMEGRLANPRDPLRNTSAIYFGHLMDPEDPLKPFMIDRFARKDPDGILIIGQTRHLGHRMMEFKDGMLYETPHTESRMFRLIWDLNPWLRQMFGSREELMDLISWSYVETPKDQLLLKEAQAINRYCSLYGEPPPLNGQVPGFERRAGRATRNVQKVSDDLVPSKVQWLTAPPRNPLLGIPCVYRAHIMAKADRTRPHPVPRIAGTDREGIIEIGQTRSFGLRKNQFTSGVVGTTKKGEGGLLHFLDDKCKRLQELFGPRKELMNCIYFTYLPTKPSLLVQREWMLINHYISLYGEPPVLNSQVPGKWRHFDRCFPIGFP